jgi:hypothetical protein
MSSISSTSSTSSTSSKDDDRLRELFERNLILLEPIIRRKMKDRQRVISFLKCKSYLTRIDEENDHEKNEKNEKKKRNKEI